MDKTSVTFDEVAEFVRAQTAHRGELTKATSLGRDLGVDGDDMGELLTAYSGRFGVDLSEYLWYFHCGEEGFNLGALFIDPPYRRVSEIPITVGMLHDFALLGRWAVPYPPHSVPRFRGDILLGWVLTSAILIIAFIASVALSRR